MNARDENWLDIIFPEKIAYGSYGGPEYRTEIVELRSGRENRTAVFENGRCRYNIAHTVAHQDSLQELIEFFRVVKGKLKGFRFKDWSDFSAKNQLLGQETGSGTGHIGQCVKLTKKYSVGGFSYFRWIKKPLLGSLKLFNSDGSIIDKDEYFFDPAIYMISFKTKREKMQEIYADFEFYVPVRFDIDYLPIIIHDNGHFLTEDIALIEIEI